MYVNVSLCECMQVSTEARSSVTFGTGIKVIRGMTSAAILAMVDLYSPW